jgi:hypothetical protein
MVARHRSIDWAIPVVSLEQDMDRLGQHAAYLRNAGMVGQIHAVLDENGGPACELRHAGTGQRFINTTKGLLRGDPAGATDPADPIRTMQYRYSLYNRSFDRFDAVDDVSQVEQVPLENPTAGAEAMIEQPGWFERQTGYSPKQVLSTLLRSALAVAGYSLAAEAWKYYHRPKVDHQANRQASVAMQMHAANVPDCSEVRPASYSANDHVARSFEPHLEVLDNQGVVARRIVFRDAERVVAPPKVSAVLLNVAKTTGRNILERGQSML